MQGQEKKALPVFMHIVLAIGACLFLSIAAIPVSTAQARNLSSGELSLTVQANSEGQQVVWSRLYGNTALDTMASIVQVGWSQSDVAIIATSEGYWDALAASSLAGANGAPVLFTAGDSLSAQTKAELERLAVKRACIAGGPSAISADVESQIAAIGVKTERLWGDNARGTAIAIANTLGDARSTTCVIATSAGYWDALSAGPFSYATKSPIFLTDESGELEGATLSAIKEGGYTRAVISGGNMAVMPTAESQLASIGVGEVKRCWGQTAYDTAVDLANWQVSQGMAWKGVGIATGNGYWDALAGAALCGRNQSVLLLADDANSAAASSKLSEVMDDVQYAYVFGGSSAVSGSVYFGLQRSTSTAPAKSEEQLALESLNGWWQSMGHGGTTWMHFVNGAVFHYSRSSQQSANATCKYNGTSRAAVSRFEASEVGSVFASAHSSGGYQVRGSSLYSSDSSYLHFDDDVDSLICSGLHGEGYSGTSSYKRVIEPPQDLVSLAEVSE